MSTPNHIHHHYAPLVTLTYTTYIISLTAPTLSPMDLWTNHTGVTAGQRTCWWTKSRKIGLPPIARDMGRLQGRRWVGRQGHG